MGGLELGRRCLIWGTVVAFIAASILYGSISPSRGSVALAAFPIVGAWILTSRPGNRVGRFLFAVGVAWILLGWVVIPELASRVAPWVEAALNALAVAGWPLLLFIGLIFPNGRIETRLGRWLSVGIAAVAASTSFATLTATELPSGRVNPFVFPDAELVAGVANTAGVVVTCVIVILIVIDLVRRWRSGTATERLQFRWFVFGMASVMTLVLLTAGLTLVAPAVITEITNPIATIAINLIPISIGIAVTRHGLYEIGRVASRAVSYALVTAFVVAMYVLIVSSVSLLLPDHSTVPVAIATLVAAAAFLPLLRRFQRIVDRRFDREHYDAQRVVDGFGEHVRSDPDPSRAAGELAEAVESTLQPASIGLWVSRGAR